MNRYAVLYLATLFVLIPLDFLFLGIVAKDFFTSQVGNMLGEIKLVPAALFYLLYVVGIVIFVSGSPSAERTTCPSQIFSASVLPLDFGAPTIWTS